MIKKVFVLFICAMMMVSGCGSGDSADKQSEVNYTQEAAKDTAGSPVVQDDFHGITFQISDRWVKDTQTDEDAIYYMPADDSNEDVVIMLLYTDFSGKGVYTVYSVNDVYEKMVEGLGKTDGISNITSENVSVNGMDVTVAKYKQGSETDDFNAVQYFFALPEQEGLLTCGYVIRSNVKDIYFDDYMAMVNSVKLP
jgi:hypothetical protein